MDERDKKRRKMSMEGESVNRDHDKQKTDDAQIVAIDDSANFNKVLNTSDIADLGTEDFKIVKTKLTFVDKSEFIKHFFECLSSGVQTTAPRRFGKSTFMNMLQIFLNIIVDEDAKPISNPESSDNYNMFMNLKLGQSHGDFVKKHCGQYPVIFITLKGVQGTTKTDILNSLQEAICDAFKQHRYLLETAPDGSMSFKNKKMEDIERFLKYYNRHSLEKLSETNVIRALKFLSEILYTHFNKKVVILIDEADAPIMKAITSNVEDEILKYLIDLLKNMLSEALKGNEFLERSLVSSSVRLSGVYSWALNNQHHAPFLQEEGNFSEAYGFTREEVGSLLEKNAFQVAKDCDGVKMWYNGYQILDKDEPIIYNGWSIIKYLYISVKKQKKTFDNYWAKSGWVDTLGKLFVNHEIQKAIDELVKGNSITIVEAEPTIDNILELKRTITYPQCKLDKSQVNFFLQLLWDDGLLNAVKKDGGFVELKIPNLEIKTEIQRKCYTQSLFEVNYKLKPTNIERYVKALYQLLLITTTNEEESDEEESDEEESDEEENDEEESEIKESEEETTKKYEKTMKKYEETMYNFVNAISRLFSDGATIPVNESELHHILFYLAYNNKLFATASHRAVVKVSEELRDSSKLNKLPQRKAKVSYQSKKKEKRGRKNECDMCVTFGTVAVIFEFKFVKNEKSENSKAALQQLIKNKYFTLLDKEEYKHVKTKIYVGMCVSENLNVTAHYLINDTDLNNAKSVSASINK